MHSDDVLTFRRQLKSLFYRVRQEEPALEGLPSSALQVLVSAARSSAPMTPSDLAAELHVTNPAVAAALRLLKDRQLIVLVRNADDGRSSTVRVTDQGGECVEAIGHRYTEWLHGAMRQLLDEREQDILITAGGLMDRLSRWEPPAPESAE